MQRVLFIYRKITGRQFLGNAARTGRQKAPIPIVIREKDVHLAPMELCNGHLPLHSNPPARICVPYISWKGRIALEARRRRSAGREKDRHLVQRCLSNDKRLLQIPPCQHSAPRIGHLDAHRTHVSGTHRSIESHPVDTPRCRCRGSS